MKPDNAAIRVMIVDDHTLFREGLQAILSTTSDIEVVAEAASGNEAVHLAADLLPDVILMDIQMEKMTGIEATRYILEAQPDTGVIMLTMLQDDASLFAAMCAGARGYILKGADKTEVLKTIRAVAQGEALFNPNIARRLTQFFQNFSTITHSPKSDLPFPELTEREREVLSLIAAGWSNPEIADHLTISIKTVSNHISNIFGKLQIADRTQAFLRAREAGLGKETKGVPPKN